GTKLHQTTEGWSACHFLLVRAPLALGLEEEGWARVKEFSGWNWAKGRQERWFLYQRKGDAGLN
ncbi:MAG: hypothetical protein NZ869_01945, partial [Thermoanaerobaculum sp.]|nr:hypothetical protein [Thermoanaerobaculum sp.]MDW7967302.1 hypothetical protein [Thermoanaerobaculum sp.]